MKHIIYIIIICFSVNVQSQSFTIDLMGGVGYTILSNNNHPSAFNELTNVNTISACTGISAMDSLTRSIALNIGVIYAAHNQQYTGEISYTYIFNSEIKMRYLDFPLLLHFHDADGIYLEIGPQVSYLLSAKEDANINNIQEELNKDFASDFNQFSLMGVIGFGMSKKISHYSSFNLGLRYGYGLTDAINNDNSNATSINHSLPYAIGSGGNGYYNPYSSSSAYATTRRIFIMLFGSLNIGF